LTVSRWTKTIVLFLLISLCSVTFSGTFASSDSVSASDFKGASYKQNTLPDIPSQQPLFFISPKNEPQPYATDTAALAAYAQEAVALLNAARNTQGLPDLITDPALTSLAENYAQDMIDRDFFEHENPEGLSPFDRMNNAGITYRWAGENLAINANVAAAQDAFMDSAGHRANILNPHFTHVGIGVKIDENGSFYVVQEFVGN
jgi:uncharacterized protein YkwD